MPERARNHPPRFASQSVGADPRVRPSTRGRVGAGPRVRPLTR